MNTVPQPASRVDKTTADYLAIALAPMLIMAVVGSLTFFLLEITYEGEYAGRLRWTLFWFVFASVLVSRIAIVHGSGYASLYGLALAAATGLLLLRYIGVHLGVWFCLALIWWSTSKLTWDCTLVEEDEDASGEGLLRVAGLDRRTQVSHDSSERSHPQRQKVRQSLWRRWKSRLISLFSFSSALPHSPGLWVVYFSLAALPVFGIGQLVIADEKPQSRFLGFILLCIYLAAGLTLLLTTSFLGLRRYLRQRRLRMPGRMAATWITVGLAVIGGALLVSLALPRPAAISLLAGRMQKIGSPDLEASMFDWFGEGAESERQGWARNARRSGNDRAGRRNRNASPDGQEFSSSSLFGLDGPMAQWSQPGTVAASVVRSLRWLVYLLLGLAALWLIKRYWRQLLEFARQLVSAIAQFINRMFGGMSPKRQRDGPHGSAPARTRPFSSFKNPFTSGMAAKLSTAELIVYSFEALQAWARERGFERRPDQTPIEFAHRLAGMLPAFSDDFAYFTRIYSRVAYAAQLSPPPPLNSVERLWEAMSTPPDREQ